MGIASSRINPPIITIIITLIWLGGMTSAHGAEADFLKINCTMHSSYEVFFFRVVEEICLRNHIRVKRSTPPVGRSLINVDQGIEDGDGPRVEGLETMYPHLIRVSEPFGEFVFGAFTRRKDLAINGWNDLSAFNVAYIHGWKIFDLNVTSAKSLVKVRNIDLLFNLLEKERVDVILLTRLTGCTVIRERNLQRVYFAESPLAVKANYLYLNERHRSLVPVFEQTLKRIKKDGTYDKLYHDIIISCPAD